MDLGSDPPEGGGIAGLQLVSGAAMEMGVTPGRAKSCAPLQWCVAGRRKIILLIGNISTRTGILASYFSAKLSQPKSTTEREIQYAIVLSGN